MEKMTKAAFWDKIEQEFPELMADFKVFIDEYKRREKWDELFANDRIITLPDSAGLSSSMRSIKFHDLPNAMQIGIFIQYTIERGGASFFGNDWNMEDHVNGVRAWFHEEKRLAELDAESK